MSTITVRIDEKIKNRLEQLSKSTARTKSYLITHAIEEYLKINEWQVEEIKKGIKEAEAGHLTDHKTVLKKWKSKFANTMD